MRVLAERSKRGEHESKVVQYVEILGKQDKRSTEIR